MGMLELILDIHNGVEPDSVNDATPLILVWLAMYIADIAMASSIAEKLSVMRW